MDYGLPDGVRTLQEWYWLGSIAAQLISTFAIIAAAGKYFRMRDIQSGETLRHLEERFRHFHAPWELGTAKTPMPPITRAIEVEGDEFKRCGLATALQKGLEGSAAERDERERAWIPRLDELLRFFMIVGALEKNRLLKRRALWDAYHYWFRTIDENPLVRIYVGLYFPVLDRFLTKHAKQLNYYATLHKESAERARAQYSALTSASTTSSV